MPPAPPPAKTATSSALCAARLRGRRSVCVRNALRPHLRETIRHLPARISGQPSEAEEALQDANLAIWRKAGQFDARLASPIMWLAMIARNKAISRRYNREAFPRDPKMRTSVAVRMALYLLALALIPLLAGACARGAYRTAPRDPEISLVTLNLYHDKAQWPKRLPAILAELKRLRPDVIALQEVIGHETLPNQAQTLAAALGYEYVFSSTDPADSPRRYGNAILTRHPILAQDRTRLEPFGDSRTALHLRIDIDGRAVNIYNTHLHWTDGGGAIRRQQIEDLLAFIARTGKDAPSLLAGDFNAQSSSPELQALNAGYDDAYDALHPDAEADPKAHSTLNLAYFAPKRIDHVFLERGAFVPDEATIILNRADSEGVWPSDHYGLHVRMRLLPTDTNEQRR